jgi:hypothetical protein
MMRGMLPPRFVRASLGILAVGCAGMFTPLEKQPDFGQYFTMRMPDDTQQAKLEGPRLHGPDLELSKGSDGYRGQGPSGTIDLRAGGGKIAGTVGSGSTELFVDDTNQGALVLRGRFAETMSQLELRPDRLAGTIGRCQYDLQRPDPRAPWYEGQRVCAGALSTVQLALPVALSALPAADRGLLLAVFLASEQVRKREAAPAPRSSVGDPRQAGRRPGVDPSSGRTLGQ